MWEKSKMKVFEDQKAQFESQEVFRRLNRETEVSLWLYLAYKLPGL